MAEESARDAQGADGNRNETDPRLRPKRHPSDVALIDGLHAYGQVVHDVRAKSRRRHALTLLALGGAAPDGLVHDHLPNNRTPDLRVEALSHTRSTDFSGI